MDIDLIAEQLEILSKNVEALNYGDGFPDKLSLFLKYFQKKEKLYLDIELELQCYKLSRGYYDNRSGAELEKLYETHGGNQADNLLRDLKPIAEKWGFNLDNLYGDLLEEFQNNTTISYIPITRWEDGKLIAGDNELLCTIEAKETVILYPFAQFNLTRFSLSSYTKYEEIITFWVFLNISKLIQIHTGLNQRASNEITGFIVNQISQVKRTRSAYEKASAKHINPKAHGTYLYEYYGSMYLNDLSILRKIIKVKEQTVKKTSFKNLKNIIRVSNIFDNTITWNIYVNPDPVLI